MTENVRANLMRLDVAVQAEMREYLYQSAEQIAELARLNVPVDEGDVENSIEVQIERRTGLRGANTVSVGVNRQKLEELRIERYGEDYRHYDYDIWLHEAVYNLGEKSEMKNDIVRSFHPKARVGNKFLERAFLALKGAIERGAKARANAIIRRLSK